ncbi:MarR family winged helix-turn-helix transcriptional regulator [Nocardia crassostreae]|uniref:MarR family winged helix-turn-helix transcriptional regulator n=1 Tax=Nocardia crassostreae TaxID=53428 RepID=UPI00082F01E3|nr:MarR family winged helix-turn-helix transcriptional regulator [Nocardia crassostreae]
MSVADPSLLKLLVQVTHSFEQELNRDLRAELDESLRPAHYAVFRHLNPEGSRVTALAESAGMTQQSMGELVTHLEKCGYVERHADPEDRRARLVVATESGRAALVFAGERIRAIEDELRTELGTDGLDELRQLLSRSQTVLTQRISNNS